MLVVIIQKTSWCVFGIERTGNVCLLPCRGALLPLVWRPWRRTSMASTGSLRFRVLVGMTRVPLHARNTAVAQMILGPSCAEVEVTRPRDVPEDDDREFFVTAWCFHLSFIQGEQVIFIPEPTVPGMVYDECLALPSLRYLVRLRLVTYQD